MKKYYLKSKPGVFYYYQNRQRRYGFRFTYSKNGRRHEKSKRGFPSAQTAVKFLIRAKRQPRVSTVLSKSEGRSQTGLTVKKWMQTFLSAKRYQWKPSTYKNYRMLYRDYVLPAIGLQTLGSITPIQYESQILNPLTERHFRRSTLQTLTTAVKAMLSSAVHNQVLAKNPLAGFRVRQGKSKQSKRLMSASEYKRFIVNLKHEPWPARFIFSLMANTGMRMGEALGLKWKSWDFADSRLHIVATRDSSGLRAPKTKQSRRTILVSRQLNQLARKYQHVQKSQHAGKSPNVNDFIIVNAKGKPLTTGDVSRLLKRCLTDAGLNSLVGHFTAHTFRHMFTSYAISSGIPIANVSKMLGHANPSITLRVYTQVVPTKHRVNISQQLADKLNSK